MAVPLHLLWIVHIICISMQSSPAYIVYQLQTDILSFSGEYPAESVRKWCWRAWEERGKIWHKLLYVLHSSISFCISEMWRQEGKPNIVWKMSTFQPFFLFVRWIENVCRTL